MQEADNISTKSQHQTKLITCFYCAYENPRGFYTRFLFAKLGT